MRSGSTTLRAVLRTGPSTTAPVGPFARARRLHTPTRVKQTALMALVLLAVPSCLLSTLREVGVPTAPAHHDGLSEEDAARCLLPAGDARRLATCPPAPPEPVRGTVCNAEDAPEWSGASAQTKRDLLSRCHPLVPGDPLPGKVPPPFLQL